MSREQDLSREFFGKIAEIDFEDEDYGTFRVTRLDGDECQFALDCSITIEDEPDFHKSWRIDFRGVRKSTVVLGYVDSFEVSGDHVLLKEYFETELRLGFRSQIEEPAIVVGELYREHFELAGSWIPFNSYLNEEVEVTRLIREGFGTLAVGPKTFINLYDTVLQRNGISTSVTNESTPLEWNGSEFNEFPELLAFLFDDRYIVADTATAQRN